MRRQSAENIEISEKHTKLKIVLLIVFIAIAIVAFTFGILGCLSTDAGWHRVESQGAGDCGGEFAFYYKIDKGGTKATDELNAVTAVYTDACGAATRIFDGTNTYDGVSNVATLNNNINKDVKIDPVLYSALEKIVAAGDRSIFLAPVYERYYGLYYAQDENSALEFDPYRNAEVAERFAEITAFANDAAHVDIVLGADNTARLAVSDAYFDYADHNGISTYIDFFVLKNAFIIDCLAARLSESGYDGLISTVDGMYTRNFGEGGDEYTVGIFDLDGEYVYPAASFKGSGSLSAVRFRDYGIGTDSGFDMFYTFSDGKTATPFVDPADGLYKSAIHDYFAYTRASSCADAVLAAIGEYIGSKDISQSADRLLSSGVYSIYCAGRKVIYNDSTLSDKLALLETDEVTYIKQYTEIAA